MAQDEIQQAGQALIILAGKDSDHGDRQLFTYEMELFEKSYNTGAVSEGFSQPLMQSLKVALRTQNYHVVDLLLAKELTQRYIRTKSDIIQAAVDGYSTPYMVWIRESDDLKELVQRLISYGAAVNGLDNDGNSPLYYACTGGHPQTFQCLIEAGADPFTFHDPVDSGELEESSTSSDAKVNLLQIALDSRLKAEWGNQIPGIWNDSLRDKWGPIVMFLLGKGLRVPLNHPSLVKFLHIACFQGNIEYLEMLLAKETDINARAGRSDDRDRVYGSALHAAVAGVRFSAVKLLLEHGADAQQKCKTSVSKQPLTPLSMACKSIHGLPKARVADSTQISMALLDSGAGYDDRQLLLQKCISTGHVELLKYILQGGCRIDHIPDDFKSFEVLQVLADSGAQIDPAQAQTRALAIGSVEMLAYLVRRFGPQLDVDDIRCIVYNNNMPMLEYLVTEYAFDINKTFPEYRGADENVNLLLTALKEKRVDVVCVLLERGADLECPGLPQTALDVFKVQLRDSGMSWIRNDEVRIFRLFLSHDSTGSIANALAESRPFDICQDNLQSLRAKHTRELFDLFKFGNTARDSPKPPGANQKAVASSLPTFPYEPLSGLRSIRLIELIGASSFEDPISCRLIPCDLTQSASFEALSYVWGDPHNRVPITVDGHVFHITVNLFQALRRLRMEQESRTIWVDSVCMNQSNSEEKCQQVSMMRDIYQSAKRVVVWLGEHADDSHHIFDYIRKRKQRRGGHYFLIDPSTPPEKDVPLKEFEIFCQRPWFYRTWTIQELALSQAAIMMCGPDFESPSILMAAFGTRGSERAYHPLCGIDGPTHVSHMRKNDDEMSWTSTLESVVKYSRMCQATDPRDKVYGLLGLFSSPLLPADYSLDASQVYQRFMQRYIQTNNTIKPLHWFGTEKVLEGLCSWVPDLSVVSSTSPLPRIFGSWMSGKDYPFETLPGLQIDGPILSISGKHIERVRAVGEELVAHIDNSPGSKGFTRVLAQWESLAAKLTYKRFPRAISDAFLDTLTATDQYTFYGSKVPDGISRRTTEFLAWYRLYGTGILREADESYFREIDAIRSWAGIDYDLDQMERDVESYAEAMEFVCYGRRFFITEQGSMGVAPPCTRPGDHVVYLPGGMYPFVLRERAGEAGMYELVGDCFLYDLDVGELFGEDHPTEITEFKIR